MNIIYQPLDNLRTEVSYSYHNGKTNSGLELTNLHKHLFNAHVNYDTLNEFQTDVYYYYYSHTATTNAINRIDISLGYPVDKKLLIKLIGQNLFSGSHIEANRDSTISLNTNIEQSLSIQAILKF